MPELQRIPARVPTEEDLTRLPRRAVVAFAARCARRILPLFGPPEMVPDFVRHLAALSQAISSAESFAAGTGPGTAAARAAFLASCTTRDTACTSEAASHAAARAAYAAAYAADVASQDAGDPVPFAFDAAVYAATYTEHAAGIWGDYERLCEKVVGDSPVPPAFFEPLA